MDSAATTQWRVNGYVDDGTTTWGEIGSTPDSNRASSGLLDPSTKHCIRSYGPTIRRYAGRYGLDWRLILAIMKQESRTSRNAERYRGATGVIELMPVTGEEQVRKPGLEGLAQPEHSIQTVIFYLRNLYDLFEGSGEADRLQLMLAAYNAGLVRVHDAQELAAYLHEEPTQWLAVRDALPLLSRQFCTLHRTIWGREKPQSGWFDKSRETIQYVNSVMDNYNAFRLALN
jgi:membrane-bound lytic murein transglycosylase F